MFSSLLLFGFAKGFPTEVRGLDGLLYRFLRRSQLPRLPSAQGHGLPCTGSWLLSVGSVSPGTGVPGCSRAKALASEGMGWYLG